MAGGISESGIRACKCDDEELPEFSLISWTFRLTTIAEDLLPGPHTLQCKLLDHTLDPGGGTEFRLIAVVHD